jgi:hypothetical protein
LDSKDHPHIVYSELRGLRYASWNGASWDIQRISYHGYLPSLALDSQNNPHISYYETGQGLMYAFLNGTNWNTEIVTENVEEDTQSAIDLDSNNMPHISYSRGWVMMYASKFESSWNIQTVDSNGLNGFSSLAIDSSGNSHISYISTAGLKYASLNSGFWSVQIVDSNTGNSYPYLVFDSKGSPHICYSVRYSEYTQSDLKYASLTSSGWNLENVQTGLGYNTLSALAMDTNGNPHICYNNNSALNYAYFGTPRGAISIEAIYVTVGVIALLLVTAIVLMLFKKGNTKRKTLQQTK